MPPTRKSWQSGRFPEAEQPQYAGRYRLESCLGAGGMGVVHLATSDSGLRLAVKVVHAEHAEDPEFRARFRQEVSAARRVSGAFTAPVVDADPEAGRPWMATLFIDGPTLSERVKRNGPLDAAELRRLGAGLAEALRDIHRAGVVHRDLKPSNVLLAADGPKVIDFGISRPSDSDLRTETGKLIGTPPFMAPEQFQRPRDVGPAADVFAMGAVLVHAATGRGPFDSDSPYIVAYQVVHNEPDLAGVPEDLAPLLLRCLAKEPEARPTPDELMSALRRDEGYDAEYVVPAQRRAPGVREAGGREPGVRESAVREPGVRAPGPEPSRASAAGRRAGERRPRRRLLWVAACTALAAAAAGAVVAVQGVAGDREPGRDTGPAGAVADAFRPWATTLDGGAGEATGPGAGAGAAATRPPLCTAGGAGLYCAAPGIKAAGLRADDGTGIWSVAWPKSAGTRSGTTAGTTAGAAGAGDDQGAAPVLSGGLLHVVAPDGSRLEALDPGSGETRWGVAIPAYAQVLYGDHTVLLVLADGRVRALDGRTGHERWTKRPVPPGAQWVAAPGGAEVFAVSVAGDGRSTRVASVDPRDGAVRWTRRLTGSLTPVPPVRADDRALVLLSADRELYTDAVVRLDLADRTARRIPLTAPADQAQAAVDGDTVYVVGSGGSLVAVDTGRERADAEAAQRWRLETAVSRVSRPVVADGRVYLMAADGRLLAVDAGRGVVVGQTEARMAGGRYTFAPLLPEPVVADGKVFGAAPDGTVFAVEAADPADW
ncbi:PQQ-binding-like beta-propeller repeat protein [Streptomyces sp. NPDC047928]|uniref:serine/threonine-protein kinase n=1 Tax=unclassified Streptomyces TaxID=2593676 RepID=UPI003716E229